MFVSRVLYFMGFVAVRWFLHLCWWVSLWVATTNEVYWALSQSLMWTHSEINTVLIKMAYNKMGSQNCSTYHSSFCQTLKEENCFGSIILLLLDTVMFTLQFSGVMRSKELPSVLSEPLESLLQISKTLAVVYLSFLSFYMRLIFF